MKNLNGHSCCGSYGPVQRNKGVDADVALRDKLKVYACEK